jgi:hypothetical protein
LPYKHANLNSYFGRAREIRILGNLSDFSNKMESPINSNQIQNQFCFQDF